MADADLLAKLKAARDNRDETEEDWTKDLPELPELPSKDRKVAVMIPKRGRTPSESED